MLSWEQIGKQNWELDGSTLRTFWDHSLYRTPWFAKFQKLPNLLCSLKIHVFRREVIDLARDFESMLASSLFVCSVKLSKGSSNPKLN